MSVLRLILAQGLVQPRVGSVLRNPSSSTPHPHLQSFSKVLIGNNLSDLLNEVKRNRRERGLCLLSTLSVVYSDLKEKYALPLLGP